MHAGHAVAGSPDRARGRRGGDRRRRSRRGRPRHCTRGRGVAASRQSAMRRWTPATWPSPIAPADPDIHLALAELYLDRGWRRSAADKMVLLGRLVRADRRWPRPRTGLASPRSPTAAPDEHAAGRLGAPDRGRRRRGARTRCYTRRTMPELLGSILEQVSLTTVVDIGITALLIYWLFSLIRGTRAVRLVIGVSVLFVVYVLAVALDLRLLTRILAGWRGRRPVRPRRGLPARAAACPGADRPGRLVRLAAVAGRVARRGATSPPRSRAAAAGLSADGHGALIVLERETGLEEVAETGVMIHGDVSADLLRTIFAPRTAAPRRRGDHPRRDDRRRRGPPAARRDHRSTPSASARAIGPPSASPSRPTRSSSSSPRRTGRSASSSAPDRPQPQRGRARAAPSARCSTRPVAGEARSAGVRQISVADSTAGRRACANSVVSSVGQPARATRRPRPSCRRQPGVDRRRRLPSRPRRHPPPRPPRAHRHRPHRSTMTRSCRRWLPRRRGEASDRAHRR